MKNIIKRFFVSSLVIFFLFTNTILKSYAFEVSKGQVGDIAVENICKKEYTFNDCNISYVISEKHYEGYNVNVTITNSSSEEIRDWKLQMIADFSIENIWNASLEKEDNFLLIENVGWNKVILPEQQVSFGFCVKCENITFPDITWLESSIVLVPEDEYSVNYEILNDWNQGYTGQIKVTNMSNSPIRDWKLSFSLENSITNIGLGVKT